MLLSFGRGRRSELPGRRRGLVGEKKVGSSIEGKPGVGSMCACVRRMVYGVVCGVWCVWCMVCGARCVVCACVSFLFSDNELLLYD